MTETAHRWRVLKFGGRSTATMGDWESIVRIIRDRIDQGLRPFLVLAAIGGVTRRIDALIDQAAAGSIGDDLEEIEIDHLARARSLAVPIDDDHFSPLIDEMRRGLEQIASTGSVPPSSKASLLAFGERLMIRLATSVLETRGLRVSSVDAVSTLAVVEKADASPARRYLRGECHASYDSALVGRLSRLDADVIVTAGFVAGNDQGETVLLGWGGSDTSASCFAVKLGADRVELWKDVPGLFTADPFIAPSGRLLRRLDYDEAEEISIAGAEIVHPGTIGPLRTAGIALEIRSIRDPDAEHTVIGPTTVRGAQVKAISARRGVTLFSLATPRMWQEAGFLSRVFEVLTANDLSIDLVAISGSNVTVSIDPADELDPAAIDAAIESLRTFCEARSIGPCAIVRLIGRELRSILPELSPALDVLDEQKVHLVSQSASDLDFAFVIDEEWTDRVVRRLHSQFFDHQPIDEIFGTKWSVIAHGADPSTRLSDWWTQRRSELLEIAAETSPVYVYDERTLRKQARLLLELEPIRRVFYAMKANGHPEVLRTLEDTGVGFECVSPGEIAHLLEIVPDIDRQRILFTPNFAPRGDYERALESGCWVTLDNLHPLVEWPELFRDRSMLLRVDPGRGQGHHKHVRTAGALSKFGIAPEQLEKVADIVAGLGAKVVGLHAHVGSGVKRAEAWEQTARTLLSHGRLFPDARIINVGGGLGVIERPGEPALDIDEMRHALTRFHKEHSEIELWMEPGRFLVAEAGVLLATVTQLKAKGTVRYVGVDTGFNSLLRPALYGAHHEILNLSRLDEPPEIIAEVVGPICETGDVLGHGRALPKTLEGDILLIATAGAYGRVMASEYNLRPPAEEAFLRADSRSEA